MVAPRMIVGTLLLGFSTYTGCAGIQDAEYALANKARAEAGWIVRTTFQERWDYSSHFERGWKAGFYDKSTGKDCDLPPVPPPCYWSHKFQSCEGQEKIADWYRGYQCGMAAAESAGFPSFHQLPMGPTAPVINKPGCGACYSPECCNGAKEEFPAAVEVENSAAPPAAE